MKVNVRKGMFDAEWSDTVLFDAGYDDLEHAGRIGGHFFVKVEVTDRGPEGISVEPRKIVGPEEMGDE